MGAQDQLDLALETVLTAKHAAMEKFETWEKEHSGALKRINEERHSRSKKTSYVNFVSLKNWL